MVLAYVLMGAAAGMLGALVGVGGGIFVVPALTLAFGIPIHTAIAASLVGVIGTSTSATVGYLRRDFSNVRLGMILEVGTTIGAVVGGLIGLSLGRQVLSGIFGVVVLALAISLLRRRGQSERGQVVGDDDGRLGGRYHDPNLDKEVSYGVRRLPLGLAASFVAGNLSGLLGIGGGVIKVPVMTIAMGVPPKAAIATSNLMIGVTACASAYLYYSRGYVDPVVTVPVVLGVIGGALVGSRIVPRVRSSRLLVGLAAVMLVVAVQMLLAAFGVSYR